MPRPRYKPNSQPFKTMRIFCEGEKTEPHYLREYISHQRSDGRASVVEIYPTNKNTPIQLVEDAIKFKKSPDFLPNDELWVVYDRESVSEYSNLLHAKAWSKAWNANICVAISNVCFEYWILLHLVDSGAAYSCFDDLAKNSPLNDEVQKLIGSKYDKSTRLLFRRLEPFIKNAKERAARINKNGMDSAPPGARPFEINPYTGIPDLLSAIDSFK